MPDFGLAEFRTASEFAESTAGFPGGLRFFAEYNLPAAAERRVRELQTEWELHHEVLVRYRDQLNAVAEDVFIIMGTTYPNAHAASMDLAQRILSYVTSRLFMINALGAALPMQFDAGLIASNWGVSREAILRFPTLPDDSHNTFIASYVARERAKLLEKFPADLPDPIAFDEIGQLAGVSLKTVQNAASAWKADGHSVSNSCSYAMVRPLCLKKWPKKKAMFPPSFDDVKAILSARD